MLRGVDVSSFQGAENWGALKARHGLSFAFCKATEGSTWHDPYFSQNWAGIKTAGLVRGAYHFARTNSSASAQAQRFFSIVQPEPGDLLALDLEVTTLGAPGTNAWAIEWADTITRLNGGRQPGIYTGSYLRNSTGTNFRKHFRFWWFPRYPSGSVTSTWPSWNPGANTSYWGDDPDIWQFSGSFNLSGEQTDANLFNGTLDQLRALSGTVHTTPPASPPDFRLPGSVADMVHDMQAVLNGQVGVDHMWGQSTDQCISALHEMKDGIAGTFDTIRLAQRCVGVTDDGSWGPASQAAFTQTVMALQASWRYVSPDLPIDGDWGALTEAAYSAARKVAYMQF